MSRASHPILLALAVFVGAQPTVAEAQAADLGFELHANSPSPFNAPTTIPFTLEEALFAGNSPVVVTMRVFDIMAQQVAQPVALGQPSGAVTLQALSYEGPGRYEALWDASGDNGSQVTPGVYIVELIVNGKHLSRRVIRSDEALN